MSVQKPENAFFVKIAPRFSVNDLDLALSFYSKLGFSARYNDGTFVILSRDGVDLHMHNFPDDPPSHSVWWIEVANIENLYQKCTQHIAPNVCHKLEAQPWGFKEFHIMDPFRNLILFAERIQQ